MRISQKEKSQLGYINQPHSPSRDPNSNSIDFSDVFGGPPRRASMQEVQTRHYDEDGDETWLGDGDEEMMVRRSWSSNPRGSPVFGDEMGTRRRYPSQDFFDDIFRGDKCQNSSPRMSGRDPSSSSPGSRVLSPVQALPPGAVPLGSPAQFSLPARLANSHTWSTSSQGVSQGGDAFSAYRGSPLSRKGYTDGEELRKDVDVDRSGGGTVVPSGGNQFHFSIHKWASKGMPLAMSLGRRNSLRSKIQLERSLSLNGEDELQSDTLVGEIQSAGVRDDCLAFKVHVVSAASKESDEIFRKSVTDKAPKLSPKIDIADGNTAVEVSSYFAEEGEDHTKSVNSASKEAKYMSKPDLYANKSDLKQSSSKLHEEKGRSGHERSVPEVRSNKRVVKNRSETSVDVDKNEGDEEVGKYKLKENSLFKRGSNRNNSNHQKNLTNDTSREKIKESTANDTAREKIKESNTNDSDKERVEGDSANDGSKGKVMEFVKIFNPEPSPKPSVAAAVDKNSKSRWRNTEQPRASSKSTPTSSKTDGKPQGIDVNYSRNDSSPREDGNHMPSSEKQFVANNVQESCQSSSTETENLGSNIASDGFRDSRSSMDVGFESFVIEELTEVQDNTSENRKDDEDIQAHESKILAWSKGKEGNIRALLSTLQYILWPDSGWKPVRLVDIIEANAVKKSYQRALLYLHPDKLQQKGAAVHQKFIAEKVFDVLQEAWDHFNTLGSI